MLSYCGIASLPCPRPQTLNISWFHKTQYNCQQSLQVFILINHIIFTQDCREIKKHIIYYYIWRNASSVGGILPAVFHNPPHPLLLEMRRNQEQADTRVHVGGGWDKLRPQRGQITMSWQHGPGYPSQFKRASVGGMWEWGLQSWRNFSRDIVDRHYRSQRMRQCRQGGESTKQLVLTLVPHLMWVRGAARKGALSASDFTQKAFSHPDHLAYLPSY